MSIKHTILAVYSLRRLFRYVHLKYCYCSDITLSCLRFRETHLRFREASFSFRNISLKLDYLWQVLFSWTFLKVCILERQCLLRGCHNRKQCPQLF